MWSMLRHVLQLTGKELRSLITDLAISDFSGNPADDWLAVKAALRAANQADLSRVANQLDFLVAFRRGHRISAA